MFSSCCLLKSSYCCSSVRFLSWNCFPTPGREDADKLALEVFVAIRSSNRFRKHTVFFFFLACCPCCSTENSGQRSASQTESDHDPSRGGQPLFLSLWAALVSAGEAAVSHSVAQHTRTLSTVLWWKATRSSAVRHNFVCSLRKVEALPGLLHRSCDVGAQTEVAATPEDPAELKTLHTVSPEGQREGR